MIRFIKRSIIKVDWLLHNQNDLKWKAFVLLGVARSPSLESLFYLNGVGSRKYERAVEELLKDNIWNEDL